jgi:hypothetical protein
MTSDEKIQKIYNSETHGRIDWFWDRGFLARYGFPGDEWYDQEHFGSATDAIDWLWTKHLEREL